MRGGTLEAVDHSLTVVVGIFLKVRVPGDFFGKDHFAIDDGGAFAVGATKVKADAVALHVYLAIVGTGGVLDLTTRTSTDLTFDPQNIPVDSQMYTDLASTTEMNSWTIDLSRSAQQMLSESVVEALPYLALILVVLVSSLYQQRQIQGRSTGAQVNPQQQMIMKVLPFMLPVFSFTMPAALVIYFVVSNLYRIGQQGYITHSLYKGDQSPGVKLAQQREKEKVSGKSGAERIGGRTTPKKGEPTPKRGDAPVKAKNSGKKKSTKSKSATGSGAGRTGKAPSRESRGGGRTTDPGSPQHKKRKK